MLYNFPKIKIQASVSPILDKIPTTFQLLYVCVWGPAIRWNLVQYFATKPEVSVAAYVEYGWNCSGERVSIEKYTLNCSEATVFDWRWGRTVFTQVPLECWTAKKHRWSRWILVDILSSSLVAKYFHKIRRVAGNRKHKSSVCSCLTEKIVQEYALVLVYYP